MTIPASREFADHPADGFGEQLVRIGRALFPSEKHDSYPGQWSNMIQEIDDD